MLYELISTQTLSSTTAQVSFTSLPQTYKSLHLKLSGYNPTSSGGELRVYLNNQANTNYKGFFFRPASSQISPHNTGMMPEFVPLNSYFNGEIDIFEYYSSTNKAGSLFNLSTRADEKFGGSFAEFNGPITSIQISINGASLGSGSRFDLYGVVG